MDPIWRVSLAYVAYFTAIGAAWPYLPVYYRSIGLDLGAIGALAGLSATVQLVASPAWGALSDRFARTRLTLPLASLLAAAGGIVLMNAHGLPAIALAVALLAGGLAGVGPILDARAFETLGAERIRYGQVRAWGSVMFVLVALSVGVLVDASGPGALFLVYVPALVLTAGVALSLRRNPTTRALGLMRGATTLLRAPGVLLFLAATFCVWTSLSGVNAFYSIQVTALGGAAQMVGLAWAIGAAVEVPIMWFFARIAVRYGTGRPLVAGALIFAIRAAISAAATDPGVLVATAPIEGLAFGLFFTGGVMFIAERAPAGLAGTAQGMFTAIAGLATIVGSTAGGLVAAWLTIPGLFAICALTSGLAAILVAVAVGRARAAGATALARPAPGRAAPRATAEEIHR